MTTTEVQPYKGWALVELMGHRKRAGLCEDVAMFGVRQLRIDIPSDKPEGTFTTEFYGGPAIYGLHPCDEKTARRLAKDFVYDRAISPYEEPAQLSLTYGTGGPEDEDTADGDRG